MSEKINILNKLYQIIKGNLDFDGDSFYFNKGEILERELRPFYEELGIEDKITFEEFQEKIKSIGDELAKGCAESPRGQGMLREAKLALDFFNELPQKIDALDAKYSKESMLEVPGLGNYNAYEVAIKPLKEKVQELSQKYKGVLQGDDITPSEVEKDIRLLKNTAESLRLRKEHKYIYICTELIDKMKTVIEISDKSQNFIAHKDQLLDSVYSNKRSIGNIIMEKIKDFLESIGFKLDRTLMQKTEKYAEKIVQEKQSQGERGHGR